MTAAQGVIGSFYSVTEEAIALQQWLFASDVTYVAGALVIFAAQFMLILALLMQRGRRRLAEKALRRSEERYRSVVDTQSELICRFLPDTTLTFVNDAYCRIRNATREQLLGTKWLELVPDAGRKPILDTFREHGAGSFSHEHEVRLPDGTIGWRHWTNHVVRGDRGRVIEYQGVGRDITEQRRAQDALIQAEAHNSAILRAIPDVMFVVSRDGTYLDYHVRDDKLLFVPPSAFLGRKVRDIMPPRLADVMMDAIEAACRRDETVIVDYDLMTDEVRYYEARIVRAGEDRVLSIVRDVSDSKRALARNRDLTGRLITSQEVERQRIARELHDDVSQKVALLNIGIEELALQATSLGERSHLWQLSVQAKEIADDLRHLSHELHASRLQSLGLIAAIEVLCRDTSKRLGVTVPFTHGTISAEVGQDVSLCIYRIAQEALNNIARHSRARHAQLLLFCENRSLVLQVADSGVGFDPNTAPQSGLGLISMRDRVTYLQGQFVIHAAPGGGTRIGVSVPLGQDSEKTSVMSLPA